MQCIIINSLISTQNRYLHNGLYKALLLIHWAFFPHNAMYIILNENIHYKFWFKKLLLVEAG